MRAQLRWYQRHSSWLRQLVAIFGPLAAIGATAVALASYELSPRRMCGSHGAHELVSPDGTYRAVLYEYDCGATTDFGTNLAVQRRTQKFDPFQVNSSERVFIADSNHQATSVDVEGLLPVTVRWIDGSHLEVSVPPAARIFQPKTSIGPISVAYVVR